LATDWMMSRQLQCAKSLADILAKSEAETLGDIKATTLIDTFADTLAETEADTHCKNLGTRYQTKRLR